MARHRQFTETAEVLEPIGVRMLVNRAIVAECHELPEEPYHGARTPGDLFAAFQLPGNALVPFICVHVVHPSLPQVRKLKNVEIMRTDGIGEAVGRVRRLRKKFFI